MQARGYPNRQGLVEAAGESIEVGGIRLGWGIGVGDRKRDGTTIVDLSDKAFGEGAVGVGAGCGSNGGEGGSYV